ncbi:hypothetical protein EOA35_09395 [Mesorhizobium sp. M8A.F.Ca.ET.023.01.1.1]|nr:hypothetical protein EOA35_09395 [Mesorhizobium sp. M8A.F.Ca.ET.023.01.1.1]
MLGLIPHVHDEIPADIMKAATDIAYSADAGVPVGSFPGAVYIARAILAERQRFVADFDGAADAGIDAAVVAERERCAEIADGMPGWKQPRDVAAAIRCDAALPNKAASEVSSNPSHDAYQSWIESGGEKHTRARAVAFEYGWRAARAAALKSKASSQ